MCPPSGAPAVADDSPDNPKDDQPVAPVLEAPPPPEAPVNSLSSLFADDALTFVTTAKFTILESLLNLLTRSCKFNEFTREILLTLMRVVKSEAGSLLEVDHTSNTLFFRAVVGQSSDKVAR